MWRNSQQEISADFVKSEKPLLLLLHVTFNQQNYTMCEEGGGTGILFAFESWFKHVMVKPCSIDQGCHGTGHIL